jgi:hypothetical protein
MNYLNANGINFIMRTIGKFKDWYNLQNKQQEEKAK